MPKRSQSSLLEILAAKYRLKVSLDGCRDQVIRGKHGDLSDFCDGEHLCATFWGNGPRFSRLRARRIRVALQGEYGQRWVGGMGDDEAVILFSPTDERSATFFIRTIGVRRKRRVSSEVIARLRFLAKLSKTTAGRALQAAETLSAPGRCYEPLRAEHCD